MRDAPENGRGRLVRDSVWITILLGSSAALVTGYWSWRGLSTADTESLESPLIGSVARQLTNGPRGLYGPFDGENPLVLIHAPLYYRLAAIAAWPMVRAGVPPIIASRVSGRSLSVLGLLATVYLAYKLARLDGAPRSAGWWSVLLLLAAPILGGFPFAVRPDMIGIALQTSGILLVLSAYFEKTPQTAKVLFAYAAFGFAVCVKQHQVGAAVVGIFMLLAAWRRGRVSFRLIVYSLMIPALILLLVLGAEEFATNGRMSRAILVSAANVGRIHPADWKHVLVVGIAAMGRSVGLIGLITAAYIAIVRLAPVQGRRILVLAGNLLVGLLFVAMCTQITLLLKADLMEAGDHLFNLIYYAGFCSLAVGFLMLLVILPASLLIERNWIREGRLDLVLVAFVSAEVVLACVLTRISTGAWANYAIEAIVLASVLTGRALSRACGVTGSRRIIVLGAATSLLGAVMHVQEFEETRQKDHLGLREIFDYVKRSPSEFFFVNRPEQNRINGRLDLVYDDWLYPVFESIGLAESRNVWLQRVLMSGSIKVVVTNSASPRIVGLDVPLPRLRFRPSIRVGDLFVWIREPLGTK